MGESDEQFDRFLRGDPDAEAEVSAIIARAVRWHGHRIPREQHDDIQQDAFADIWDLVRRPGFVLQRSFSGLIREVTYCRCIDWGRGHRREPVPLDVDLPGGARPDTDLLERERTALRHRVVSGLRQSHRELIRLHVLEERGYGEIARLQGKSEDAVRRMFCDALKEARRLGKLWAQPRLRIAGEPK